MPPSQEKKFVVGAWLVEPELDQITHGSQSTYLRAQIMELLVYLARHHGRVVSAEDLLEDLWAGKIVTSGTVYNCVAELRHALTAENDSYSYIETIPKKGYRLVAPVAGLDDKPGPVGRFGRKLVFAIIGLTAAAILYIGLDGYMLDLPPSRPADELSQDAAPSKEKILLAVLPLENLSGDPAQEFFNDGLTGELIAQLGSLPRDRIGVIARTSAMYYKGKEKRADEIGRELGVDYLLEGSVQRTGNQLRITAQLIEVATDTHLWAETYDRELKSVFAIQDEITAAVVNALKITLLGEEPKSTETNPEAYALYLQGRYFADDWRPEPNRQAETLLKQALAIDPDFAPAWTELGIVYNRRGTYAARLRPVDETKELARNAINKALAIDPEFGRAYAALGEIERAYDWDFTAAHQHLQLALAMNPGDAYILQEAGLVEELFGRHDKAIELYRQMIALDPVSPKRHLRLGMGYLYDRRLGEAAESFHLGLSLTPGQPTAGYGLVIVLLLQGNVPAALAMLEQETNDFWHLHGMVLVQYALGDAAASDAALQELIDKYGASNGAFQIAEVYAVRGEFDYAFDWLERAYDNRDTGMPFLLARPLLANLQVDPRWVSLLDKMGLPH